MNQRSDGILVNVAIILNGEFNTNEELKECDRKKMVAKIVDHFINGSIPLKCTDFAEIARQICNLFPNELEVKYPFTEWYTISF